MSHTVLLIQPPLVQPNTPYPAIPMLTRHLRNLKADVVQRDFSLELLLRIFTPDFVAKAANLAATNPVCPDAEGLDFFAEAGDDYAGTVADAIAFLQGRRPELAWRIAARTMLPEGPHFAALDEDYMLNDAYGTMGTTDQAKFICSLYLDDLAGFIAASVDPDFGFGKYAERLSVALPTMDPLLERLNHTTPIDAMLDDLTTEAIKTTSPAAVGLSIPFPGTLYGALRIAAKIREISPQTKIAIGGGYVNSELRDIQDRRIHDFVDDIFYDEGFVHIAKFADLPEEISGAAPRNLPAPDYRGLDLDAYFNIVEMTNPMHRIWTDGTWLKMQISRGCYWHKCAFCDLALDYIGKYVPATAECVVDSMETLMKETGRTGFHFVDEALSPALIKAISTEILKRGIHPVWWGNIRFDKAFTPELTELMADAGCIAVTGGLECANDRLLKLMNKGITLNGARIAMTALANVGILVHAYLMYGFPTETQKEALGALEFVRDCFADGILHSAFWHRFALTVHSAIAQNPTHFGIEILPYDHRAPQFALNEIPFREPGNKTDWDRIGRGLSLAVYNYMLRRGLDEPPSYFIEQFANNQNAGRK